MVSLTNETDFLISFIRDSAATRDSYRQRILSREIDFLKVLDAAKEERLLYPFFDKLSFLTAQDESAPQEVFSGIKKIGYAYLSQSLSFSKKVADALEEIDSIGVKVLLFKGPAVDCFIYPSDTQRPRSDLDFLVRECDLPLLEGRIQNLGYVPEKTQDYPIFEFSESRVFTKNIPDTIPLHIHKHILNNLFFAAGKPLKFNENGLWQETSPFLHYRNVFCLQPEAQILFLIEHSLKHDFSPLVQLYEIDSLLSHCGESFKWDRFISLSREFGLTRAVYIGLLALKKVFFTPIPEDIFPALEIDSVSKGEELFLQRVFGYRHRKYFSYAVYLAMQEGLANKFRYIGRTLFPPRFSLRAYAQRIARGIAFAGASLRKI